VDPEHAASCIGNRRNAVCRIPGSPPKENRIARINGDSTMHAKCINDPFAGPIKNSIVEICQNEALQHKLVVNIGFD